MEKELIILVDDEKEILNSYRSLLGRWYIVETFPSGEELLKAIDRFDPALFVVDWLMPGIDGISLCRRIREDRRFDTVPIAFFTAIDPSLENMRLAFESGAQSFISKQSAPDFIVIQINTLVNYSLLLARLFRDQQLVFSVLEHDMSNLLTAVTAGVEILSRHPAFRDRELASQVRTVLSAGAGLRTLFLDLTEMLTFYRRQPPSPGEVESLAGIEEDLRSYLEHVDRKVKIDFPRSPELRCDRKILGRALYYQVRFIDNHLPAGAAISVRADRTGEGVSFSAGAKGSHRAAWSKYLNEKRGPEPAAHSHDLLFLEYVRHAARRHRATLSVVEERGRTDFRFSLPRDRDRREAAARRA